MMRGIGVVEEYKFLGCMVNDQLNCARMVDERANSGAKALSDWTRRCRVAVGELRGKTFVKLWEMLVDLVLLYEEDVWGSCGQLAPIETIQLRVARIFLGVGGLHPKVSLLFELNTLQLKWEGVSSSG